MMNIFRQTLGNIAGGRVLDVATQHGGFVRILAESLMSFTTILGIDITKEAVQKAQNTFAQENIQFMQMDAEQMGFEGESFDTVSISASLHHLENILPALREMKRVLRPGGSFILAEMHRDAHTEAQLNAISLHQWAAEVDSALGIIHNHTLSRQEFVDYIESLRLRQVEFVDLNNIESDPMDEAGIERLESLIDRYIQRSEGATNYNQLKQRGEELRNRIREVGAQSEPVLIITGKKG